MTFFLGWHFFWGGTCFSTGANSFSQVCYVHIGLVIVPCQRRQVPSTESAASFWISSCFMPVVASLKSSCGGWTSATVGFFGWLSSYIRDKSTQRVDSVYKNSLKIHQPLVFQWKLRIVSWKIPEKLVYSFFWGQLALMSNHPVGKPGNQCFIGAASPLFVATAKGPSKCRSSTFRKDGPQPLNDSHHHSGSAFS